MQNIIIAKSKGVNLLEKEYGRFFPILYEICMFCL